MADILSYLDWRGDLSFEERPFNDVDNLILSELAYLDMTGIVPGPGENGIIALKDVYPRYVQMGYDQSCMPNDPRYLACAASQTRRFGEIRLWRYADEIDRERQIQFAAVTCFLPGGGIYVDYRGTDHSLVGWREDFNTSFMNETPGQQQAVLYLNAVMAATEGPVMVGGHSKGGNLAVYAAAFCDEIYRDRISIVYSNDGPGFNDKITETEEYRAVLPKVQLTIPESSIIGIIMDNKHASRIVRCSSSNWLEQHNPYSWQVNFQGFELAEDQSGSSRFLNSALDHWISSL
ncbi:MAG: Mbeg1-like protein, partial [bacterium]